MPHFPQALVTPAQNLLVRLWRNIVRVCVLLALALWLVQPHASVLPTADDELSAIPIDPRMVVGTALSPDEQLLAVMQQAVMQQGGTLTIWRWRTKTLLQTFQYADPSIRLLSFSPDGHFLATLQHYGGIKVWRVSDGALLQHFQEKLSYPRDLAFSADSRLLAAALDGNAQLLKVWRLSDGAVVRAIPAHAQPAAIAISPDGTRLASGFQDSWAGRVELWRLDVVQAQPERVFDPGAWAFAVAFSPDGTRLAASGGSGGDGGWIELTPDFLRAHATVTIWRLDTGAFPWPAQRTTSPQESISSLAFSADGRQVLASGDEMLVAVPVAALVIPWWWPLLVAALIHLRRWWVGRRRAQQGG